MFTMNNNFGEWLLMQMGMRGWSQSDLAHAAFMDASAINMLVRGTRGPGVDSCQAIARALDLPAEAVYRAAGFLPPVTPLKAYQERLVKESEGLEEEEQELVLALIKLMKERKKELVLQKGE